MTQQSILYKKKPVKPRTWKIVFTIWFLIGFIPAFLDPSDSGFIVDFLAYALTWGWPVGIWALTLAGNNHYGTVTITDKHFKVGTQSVSLDDISLIGLSEAAADTPDWLTRLIKSSQQIDIPVKYFRAEDIGTPKVFGGAWAVPLGSDSFLMQMKDKQQYVVPIPKGEREAIIKTLRKAAART